MKPPAFPVTHIAKLRCGATARVAICVPDVGPYSVMGFIDHQHGPEGPHSWFPRAAGIMPWTIEADDHPFDILALKAL